MASKLCRSIKMSDYKLRFYGDHYVDVIFEHHTNGHIITSAKALRELSLFQEVVPTASTISLSYDPYTSSAKKLPRLIKECFEKIDTASPQEKSTILEIPVSYDGPDLSFVADHLDLSVQEFIKIHTSTEYHVEMIGFLPGFSYLTGGSNWEIPRLTRPRSFVPAGAVGLAGNYTGIYPLPGPGGWRLIGQTHMPLFQPESEKPFAITPETRVRFVEVT